MAQISFRAANLKFDSQLKKKKPIHNLRKNK